MLRGAAHAQTPARLRRTGRAGDRRRDAGFVVFLLLIIIVVGSVAVFLNGLNTASASMKLRRDDATTAALKQAKEGLIAWAAASADDGPGHLPCPDRNQIDSAFAGYRESTCVGAAARIGRLPFRTLGLPDLRDASGERLWYALSVNFRDKVLPAAGGPLAVNSDTQGSLTVEGRNVGNGVVAVIFAPGATVGAQVRNPAVSNNILNYLEAPNPYVPDAFLAWSGCEATACPLPFTGGAAVTSQHNDQFIVITHEDLFRVVEPVVQRRIELEIAPQLTKPADSSGYFERWGIALYGDKLRGFFPFAAPYNDPSRPTDDYLGAYDQINGLMPVTRDTDGSRVRWNAPPSVGDPDPPTVTVLAGGGSITPFDPSANCNTGAGYPVCSFEYTCVGPVPCTSLRVRFQARLKNVAESFVANPGDFVDPASWEVDGVALPSLPGAYAAVLNKSLVLAADGGLRVTLEFTLPETTAVPFQKRTVPIRFPAAAPAFSTFVTPTNWFISNGWHRQTYYAISAGFQLRPDLGTRFIDRALDQAKYDAAPPCLPAGAPLCISVDKGPAKARAVLVLAGRHLAGGVRTYTVANYFEKKNADVPSTAVAPANQEFERGLRAGDFNDRVVVVSPEPPGP